MILAQPIDKRSTQIADIADSARSGLRTAVYQWLMTLKSIPQDRIYNPKPYLSASIAGAGQPHDTISVHDVYLRIFHLGMGSGLDGLRHVTAKRDVASSLAYLQNNQRIASQLDQYSLNLVTQISEEARNSLREIISSGLRRGINPRQQARDIESMIGLTSRQVSAVQQYRQMLESGNLRSAMDRALRDRRYDRTLLNAATNRTSLQQAQIDRMVQRYIERQLKYRAEMIARTESIRAANGGMLEVWKQAKEQNLLPDTMRMFWIVSNDERTCEICKAIPGMNANRTGVPIGGIFWLPTGAHVDQPPAHPNCRCTIGLK